MKNNTINGITNYQKSLLILNEGYEKLSKDLNHISDSMNKYFELLSLISMNHNVHGVLKENFHLIFQNFEEMKGNFGEFYSNLYDNIYSNASTEVSKLIFYTIRKKKIEIVILTIIY